MFRSIVTVALFSVLCAFASSQTCTGDIYQPINGMNTSFYNTYLTLLSDDIKAQNATVNAESGTVSTCIEAINAKQAECIQCINTTCQARVDALGCTDVASQSASSSGSCDLTQVICDMGIVVAKAGVALTTATNAVKQFAEKTFADIKKVADQVIDTIGTGLKTAGSSIKDVAEKAATGIAKTAENIASEIGKVAETVGKKIATGIEDAANAVKNVAEDGVKEVKKFFENIGRKRRQAPTMEPTCDTFTTDTNACLFYHSQCASCAAFGLGSATEATVDDLMKGVCSQADLDSYNLLNLALSRMDEIIDVYTNFTLYVASFDPTTYNHPNYSCIKVDFGMMIQNVSIFATPHNPYADLEMSGATIANDVYKYLLPK